VKRLIAMTALLLTACSTYHSTYPPTPRQYCEQYHWDNESKKQACIAENNQAIAELISKLHRLGITDEHGNLLKESKKRTEYRIFNYCEAKWRPIYSGVNYCFDYRMKENERRGTWGVNSPAMWWWRNTTPHFIGKRNSIVNWRSE